MSEPCPACEALKSCHHDEVARVWKLVEDLRAELRQSRDELVRTREPFSEDAFERFSEDARSDGEDIPVVSEFVSRARNAVNMALQPPFQIVYPEEEPEKVEDDAQVNV